MYDIFSKFAGEEHWQELLEEFVGQLPQRLTALSQAIAANDVQGLAVLVHQLKGACGSYGFDEITPLAERLEKAFPKALHKESATNGLPEELASFLEALQSITHRSPEG
jgi:HPt (histidine-containing phosphotransfer) domain-containing protein